MPVVLASKWISFENWEIKRKRRKSSQFWRQIKINTWTISPSVFFFRRRSTVWKDIFTINGSFLFLFEPESFNSHKHPFGVPGTTPKAIILMCVLLFFKKRISPPMSSGVGEAGNIYPKHKIIEGGNCIFVFCRGLPELYHKNLRWNFKWSWKENHVLFFFFFWIGLYASIFFLFLLLVH